MNEHRHLAFPVAWVTTGKHLLLIGGCTDRLCRLKHALAFDWERISIQLPADAEPLCETCLQDDRVTVLDHMVTEDDIANADLVIEGTEDPATALELDGWCEKHGVPLNAMDQLPYCDFHYSSLITRGPLVLSIASGGRAPALGSRLRSELEQFIGPGWAEMARQLAETRESLPAGQERNKLLKNIAQSNQLMEYIEANDPDAITQWIKNAVNRMSD